MTPAVEGVEQAHGFLLIIGRAGLHDGADQDLQQTAADGVDQNGEKDAHEGIRKTVRKDCQQNQTCTGAHMGQNSRCAVADLIDKDNRQEVDQQLQTEVEGDQHRDLLQGDTVLRLKGQEQQGDEIIDDGLHHIADEAGVDGFIVRV